MTASVEHVAPPVTASSPADEPIGSLLAPERLAIWGWVLGYTAVLSSLCALRYHLWLARGYDLGRYEQALWLLAHRGPHAVSTYTGQPVLASLSAYGLAVLAPLYATGGVGLLLVSQSLALGLGYLLVRRIGRTLGTDERVAHLLGVMYLAYPTVLGANLYDFHPEALGVPLVFGVVWCALEERWPAYALLWCAALVVAGAMPLLLIGTGVALLLRRNTAWGLASVAAGAAAAYVETGTPVSRFVHPAGGLSALAHLAWPGWLGDPRAWVYLAALFGPLAGVAATLRGRILTPWWIPGIALVAANLWSGSPVSISPINQMSLPAVPFFFVAALAGARPGQQRVPPRWAAAAWLIPSLLLLIVLGWHQYRASWRGVPSDAEALRAAVASVPPEAPVVAQNFIAAYLADRDQEWLPGAIRVARLPAGTYVILDPGAGTGVTPRAALDRLQKALATGSQAAVVFSRSGITVYRLLRQLPTSSLRGQQ